MKFRGWLGVGMWVMGAHESGHLASLEVRGQILNFPWHNMFPWGQSCCPTVGPVTAGRGDPRESVGKTAM